MNDSTNDEQARSARTMLAIVLALVAAATISVLVYEHSRSAPATPDKHEGARH